MASGGVSSLVFSFRPTSMGPNEGFRPERAGERTRNVDKESTLKLGWRVVLAGLIWGFADWAALRLWMWSPVFVRYSYARELHVFELYSFTHAAALLGIGGLLWPWFRARRQGAYPLAVFLLLGFLYLTLFEKFDRPSYDYSAWHNGMVSQVLLGDPYSNNPNVSPIYWYPPALAQMMAGWRAVADHVYPDVRTLAGSNRQTLDHIVFYVFQCTQFTLLLIAFWLTYAWTRLLKADRRTAALATGFLLLFNVPLLRLLGFHQPNLWLVNAILAILLFRDRIPWLAGLALAVGFHVKLYPAILGLPLLLAWKWKPILWAGVFTLAIFGIECAASGGDVWLKFLAYISDPPIGSYFRDNSLHALAKNALKPFGLVAHEAKLWAVFLAVAAGWMAWRMLKRARLRSRLRAEAGADAKWADDFYFFEQLMDTLVLSFFLSPQVFEHHYVMAIPIMLWTAFVWGRRAPLQVLVGCLLILVIPIYDVGPLSWNRIAGLLVLTFARPVGYRPPPDGILPLPRLPEPTEA